MPAEEENDLTPEELEDQEAEPLPDREVMTVLGGPMAPKVPVEYVNLPVPEDAA